MALEAHQEHLLVLNFVFLLILKDGLLYSLSHFRVNLENLDRLVSLDHLA
jgi:hypothetical protein